MGIDIKEKKLDQRLAEEGRRTVSQGDLPDLLKFLDFEKLAKSARPLTKGELSLRAKFPEVEGLPTELVFGHQIFALNKDRSVVPHGHDNMATAFYF